MSLATARIPGLPHPRPPASLETFGAENLYPSGHPDDSTGGSEYPRPPSPSIPPLNHGTRQADRPYHLTSWTSKNAHASDGTSAPTLGSDGTLQASENDIFVYHPLNNPNIAGGVVPKNTKRALRPGTNVVIIPPASTNPDVPNFAIYHAVSSTADKVDLSSPEASRIIAERLNGQTNHGEQVHVAIINVEDSMKLKSNQTKRHLRLTRSIGSALLTTAGIVGMKYNMDTEALAASLAAAVLITDDVMQAGLRMVRGEFKPWRKRNPLHHGAVTSEPK